MPPNQQILSCYLGHNRCDDAHGIWIRRHDSVSQALYGISIGARTTGLLLAQDAEKARESNEYVRSLANTGLAEMWALIFDLRPEGLEQEGLEVALRRQGAALESRHGIRLDVSLDGEPDIPMGAKEALYRIAQEAIHNTVKHAQARAISLSLRYRDEEVLVEIQDGGRGFDVGGSYPGHIGLHSMGERAMRLGGTVFSEES